MSLQRDDGLGADVVINTISNVLSKTLFKERVYNTSVLGLEVGKREFGYQLEKVAVDSDFKEDGGYGLTCTGVMRTKSYGQL